MKAYVLKGINKLVFEEVDKPAIESDDEVIVKVKATGICSSDIPRIFVKGTYHFPTIPGHEFSGIVVESKDNKIIGNRVGVFPLIPCKRCTQCSNHKYQLCDNYNYLGSRCDGGFAEYVKVPKFNLINLPDSISYEQGALLEPLCVSYHAIQLLNIKKDDSVAIVGSGLIGIAASIFAKMFSDNVSLIARNDLKKKYVPNGINYVLSSNINAKFDKIIEAVGTNESLSLSIDVANTEAKIVLVGNPANEIMSLSQSLYWKILRKQLTVSGSWNSTYGKDDISDWVQVRDLLASSSMAASLSLLISHRFDSIDLPIALDIMKNHNENYCKVMVLWK